MSLNNQPHSPLTSLSTRHSAPIPNFTASTSTQRREINSLPATLPSEQRSSTPTFTTSTQNSTSDLISDEKNPSANHHDHEFDENSSIIDSSKPSKSKRSCAATLDFDWTYKNIHATGSRNGRKTIGVTGSGAPGACLLM